MTAQISTGETMWAVLRRLDERLLSAVSAAAALYGPDAAADPYRGLYVSREEVDRLLVREPDDSLFGNGDEIVATGAAARLDSLRRNFGLDRFAAEAIVIALAPEFDLRYERLYGYLQDDVTRKHPSVDLVLNLLCTSAEDKLAKRGCFSPSAPLIRQRLLHAVTDARYPKPALGAHFLKVDDQIVAFLFADPSLDQRIVSFCRVCESEIGLESARLSLSQKQTLHYLCNAAPSQPVPMRLYFHGSRGNGQRIAAEAVAHELGMPLLIADLRRVLASCGPEEADERLRVLFRDATFREAVLFLEQADVALGETPELAYGIFFDYMRRHGGVVLMSGERPWDRSGRAPEGVVALPFATPDPLTRRTMWRSNIDRPDDEIETVASRFKLSAAQIEDAAAIANWTGESLFASARLQNTGALAGLAQKIEDGTTWSCPRTLSGSCMRSANACGTASAFLGTGVSTASCHSARG
jgi:hypothetical protein